MGARVAPLAELGWQAACRESRRKAANQEDPQ
jgi:hypothetical protein